MSNDNIFERLFKQWGTVCKLIMDHKRDPQMVAKCLQSIIDKPVREPRKFTLFADLGIITVPGSYMHETRLDKFWEFHQRGERKSFDSYDGSITDANFPKPSRILKPGDRLWVRAFRQVSSGTTTSEERMAFLATQKAVYPGAQGASLVFDQKRKQLPKGFWYASFDEEERLWEDSDGNHRVSCIGAESDGDFDFSLGSFESEWVDRYTLLCFSELPVHDPLRHEIIRMRDR